MPLGCQSRPSAVVKVIDSPQPGRFAAASCHERQNFGERELRNPWQIQTMLPRNSVSPLWVNRQLRTDLSEGPLTSRNQTFALKTVLMGWTPPTASMCHSGGVETPLEGGVHG
jgi:hypothetical protein